MIFSKSDTDLRKVKMSNRGNFEVLPVAGHLRGYSRKMVVIGCYIPPNYTTARARECLEHIRD